MTNISLDSLPAKTGTVSNAGIFHYRESGVDKKLTVADLLTKILSSYNNLDDLEALASITNLSNFANLTPAANKVLIINGSGAMAFQDRLATTTNQGVAYLNNPITFANNASDANNDIDFSPGTFQFSDGSGQAIYAGGTGQLDVLFGTGNGMLATGTKAINSTYHLYMVSNPTTGVSKPLAILGISGTAPDPTSLLPSGYTKFKRVGSILTDGSGNIRQASYTFFLGGYYCNYNTEISDAFSVALTTTKVSLTLSTPKGIQTIANVHPYFDMTNGRDTLIIYEGSTSKPYFYVRGGATTIAAAQVGNNGNVKTNLSSQIDWKTTVFSIPASLLTNGFTDYTN
jgi:hypothetical protein